jgi:hypothetical protein
MAAGQPGGLQALTSFTVTADYRRHETTFDIWLPDQREPAARLYKDGQFLSRGGFDVLTGARLDEPAGRVARNGAWAADGAQIGTIAFASTRLDKKLDSNWLTSGMAGPAPPELRARRWRVEQAGLPPLSGGPAGLSSRLRFNGVTDLFLNSDAVSGANPVDYLLPFTFRFGAPGVAGFEISRRAGRSRLHVAVRDPRIDRRLVLACVVCVNVLHNPTLRRAGVGLTTTPFKK